jgi:integrase
MAINIHCTKCSSDMRLTTKVCLKCKTPIPVRKRTYRVVVRVHGKRQSQLTTNLTLAKEIEQGYKNDNLRDEHNLTEKIPAPTLDEVWEKFKEWAKENKKSWKTDLAYYRKHLKPPFGAKKLNLISPFDIEKLILTMKKSKTKRGTPYAPATIRHQLVLLSRLITYAQNMGLYSGTNNVKKIKKPKLNNQVTEFLSDTELARLHEVLDTWPNPMSACFVRFALYTGFRKGELYKLRWSDVDLDRGKVTLVKPKGGTDKTLPISEAAVKVLGYIPQDFNSEFVFYGRDGSKRTDFRKPWFRIREKAGLPGLRFHALRHHFASALANDGVDLYTIQQLLTHKNATTTQRYAHLKDETLRAAVVKSDALHQKSKTKKVVNIEERKNA